jgi:hypothetical protein
MNSANDHQPLAAQFRGTAPDTCFVCGHPIGEHCFCRIHREKAEPIMLCCADCTVQYLDAGRVLDSRAQELGAYENSSHFFVGENKPWLSTYEYHKDEQQTH